MAPSAAPPASSAQAPPTPQVRGFRIMARRTGAADALSQSLSALSFLRVSADPADPQTVLGLNIESRDIQKNPYLFSILYFRPSAIDVAYTQLPGTSPKMRKLDLLKYALNLLTLISDQYTVDMRYLYQLLEGALSDLSEYVSADYNQLYSKYDSLSSDVGALQRKVRELGDANANLAKDNYDLKGRNDELMLRLQSLEMYSDSVLAIKAQEWLAEHNGEINLSDFCRVHNVTEARVEQVLNKLVSEGYLESRK